MAPLDRFARRCYQSAVFGLVVAVAAVLALRLTAVTAASGPGQALIGVAVTGAVVFVGGGTAGSARPRTKGGTR